MRHRFTPRTSVEKSDWHTWSPAPTPRLLQQGRGLPHRSLSPRWGEGQGEGKNMPATARQTPRARAWWRPDTFRWSGERSGGRRGVEDQPNRGGWIRSGVNGKLPEEKSLRFNADRIWESRTACHTSPPDPGWTCRGPSSATFEHEPSCPWGKRRRTQLLR
jgi:hypothetical protein